MLLDEQASAHRRAELKAEAAAAKVAARATLREELAEAQFQVDLIRRQRAEALLRKQEMAKRHGRPLVRVGVRAGGPAAWPMGRLPPTDAGYAASAARPVCVTPDGAPAAVGA